MNRISIITVNRNNYVGLRKTIDSVVSQSVRPFEYIVIDGASTDGSDKLLKEFNDEISYSVSEPDSGIYNAMNKGLSHSSGDYCLFLNSGDALYDSEVLANLSHLSFDEDLIIGQLEFDNGSMMRTPEELSLLYFTKHSLPHGATLIKRGLLERNPYDETLKIVSDWKFFLQEVVLNNASFKIIELIINRFDTQGISSQNRAACALEKEAVLQKLFPERILTDYRQFNEGSGYRNTSYDRFYVLLRDYKIGKILYTENVILCRLLSYLKKSLKFTRSIPLTPSF